MTATDYDVAAILLRSRKPIVLCVNKVDAPGNPPPELYEFYNLGLGDPFPVSSLHGSGTGDLLDECFRYFPKENDEVDEDDRIKVAVIGKPNAGKSSLINSVLGKQRVIVSDVREQRGTALIRISITNSGSTRLSIRRASAGNRGLRRASKNTAS